jgi:methylated-DNA-[protein]-cysteine S-methyltransferase
MMNKTHMAAIQRRTRNRRETSQSVVRWGEMASPLGKLFVAVSERGICAVEFGRRRPRFPTLLKSGAQLKKIPRAVAPALTQLRQYFAGARNRFDLPTDLSALTPFQRKVLAVTQRIPPGQVWTYQRVARAMGRPQSARPVGQALGRNPIAIIIPCHRVIASDNSLRGYSGGSGLSTKRWLLLLEGAPL